MKQTLALFTAYLLAFWSLSPAGVSLNYIHAQEDEFSDVGQDDFDDEGFEEPASDSVEEVKEPEEEKAEPVTLSEDTSASSVEDAIPSQDPEPVTWEVEGVSVKSSEEQDEKLSLATLFLFSDSYTETQAKHLKTTLASQLDDLSGHNYSDTEAELFVPTLSDSQRDYEKGLELFKMAKRFYDELAIEAALKLFEEARSVLEKHVDKMTDITPLSKILLYSAASHYAMANEEIARKYFISYLNINPDAVLDEVEFAPDVVTFYKKLKEEFLLLPNGSLIFQSQPAGSLVWLDGRIVGSTPLRVDGVTAGTHYYRIHSLGYKDEGGLVDVQDKEEHEITSSLNSYSQADELRDEVPEMIKNFGDISMLDQALKQGKMLKVDRYFVVLISSERTKITLKGNLFIPSKGSYKEYSVSFIAPEDGNFNKITDVRTFLDNFFGDKYGFNSVADQRSMEQAQKIILTSKKDDEKEKPFYTQWWFWTAAGAAVLATAGTTYYLVSDDEEEKGATLDVTFSGGK